MPSVLNIPTEQLHALTVLRELGSDGITRLAQAIRAEKVLLRIDELQKIIAPVLGQDADVVGEVLVGLSLVQRRGRGPEAIIDDLTETLESRSEELSPAWADEDFERWSLLREPLVALFSAEPLLTVGKALDLQFAHTNILSDTQVVTDMRPVFDSAGESPLAVLVSHTLCLRYLDEGRRERLSIALDHDDLVQLVRACERAMKKESSLKATFGDLLRTEIAGENAEGGASDGAG